MSTVSCEPPVAQTFPDFGYVVRPEFNAVDIDPSSLTHIPDGSPTGFKGVISALRFLPRDSRTLGEVDVTFDAADTTLHSDILGSRQQREFLVAYASRVWNLGGRFSWNKKNNTVLVQLWVDAGSGVDIVEIPERRGLGLAIGLACGGAVMQQLELDPSRSELELTMLPNFKTRRGRVQQESLRRPLLMAQALEALELR